MGDRRGRGVDTELDPQRLAATQLVHQRILRCGVGPVFQQTGNLRPRGLGNAWRNWGERDRPGVLLFNDERNGARRV